MKPKTTEEILELMNGGIVSAAVGAAMEAGVFWLLARKPLPAVDVARILGIPLNRCHHWLQILCTTGLLENTADGYAPSTAAREAVLDVLSQDTWAFQAREYRDSSLFVRDLALNIGQPMPAWQVRSPASPDYFQQMQEDAVYAARFTRKLYEIHRSLAERLADMLDLRGVRSLLDLGGGSGVMSLALLRKQPGLASVVVDVENVCRAGRMIAAENQLEKRITYLAADFLQDNLPAGFDMVLLCDVGLFDEALFSRIHAVLHPEGRLVIVDKFALSRTSAPPSRLTAAFVDSLQHPAQSIDFMTTEMVQSLLLRAGFRDVSVTAVPHTDHLPWNIDWSMLAARK